MKALLLLAALGSLQAETLHYTINWPSGLNLGEASIRADHKGAGWEFATDIDASVPGFAIRDAYKSTSDGSLCSATLEKTSSRGSKKTQETLQ